MKELQRLSNSDLWEVGYLLTDMIHDVLRYFASLKKHKESKYKSGRPYNAINDGVEGQSDLYSAYLDLKKIMDPLYFTDTHNIRKKYTKIEKKIKELNKLLGEDS